MSFNKDQFKDKVVIVTGAGGGIGRSHALGFAKAGAKVVVNDLGSARDGKGASHNMADIVVQEIKSMGGEAVANYDSVADMKGAENIVKTAIDNYGKIDFVINNAGILRDKTFLKMTEDMWDLVIAVHLKGTYAVSAAAAPHMKEQKSGRIVNTTSLAGLLGNFGQSNYSAAKAGIYGFTRTLALEMERYGVTVNAIAPIAKTRMTEDIDAVPDEAKPEQITPMVMYLCAQEASEVNGRIFGIHGQHLFEYKMEQTEGVEKKTSDFWTPEEINSKFKEITKVKSSAKGSSGVNISDIVPKLNEVLKETGLQLNPLGSAPTTAQQSKGEVTLSDMFQKMTEVFLPEKAAGFDGLIQFDIAGDKPQALYISGSKVDIKAEKGSNPACTITTDKESMLEMLQGKADPTKLFMKGKIKADKMPVLMKFNGMFNLSALPEKIKSLSVSTSATSEQTQELTVSSAFQKMKEVFNAEKAGDWKGIIQFDIAGDEPQAIYIDDGSVDIKVEKAQNPDCTITTDKESMLEMLQGKADPTKLFMKGKIKADKMPILMKYNTMFNLKDLPEKLQGPAPSTTQSSAAAVPTSFSGMFQKISEVFIPEKAGGFSGSIQFIFQDEDPQYLDIENQKVLVKTGKADGPKLTIRTDKATMDALMKGETDATKAVMKGQIKADHMSLLMKFGNMFDLSALPSKLASGSQAPASSQPSEGLNRDYIGKWFYGTATHVRPEDIKKYASATNETNSSYFKDNANEIAVPPIFSVTLLKDMFEQVLTESDLNMDVGRMVHGEHEIIYYRPLKAWDLVYTVAQIVDIETKATGELMKVQVHGKVDGYDVFIMNVGFFVRGKGGSKKQAKKETEPETKGQELFKETMNVQSDQSKRYADASGDHNPIHLDPDMAKAVGLPDIILHGLCTMAFASQAIVKHEADNNPSKLTQIGVRFSKPVFMGDVLTTTGWLVKQEGSKKYISFETVNGKGDKVITQGTATLEI